MTDPVEQVRAQLVLSARVIMTDHWPPTDGRRDWCPICNCHWKCRAMLTAYAYLRLVGAHIWIPPHLG
ncbi:hypothetical protein [Micromonospora endophytica]|uniref:Uncharacterized protein n=1 Tax=Micromonospora endophytica TaxID=515350 RepID=A0A2W2BRA9_9ACTN|nr:hypothetical protein [Micromonospora endophytica]PZF89811.1 hypothetical protein C1I93_23490 [Micromonospora endophytica]RIW45215.1 hypothetical protein D3H59_15625 [Micromonospora endophytica]BCJ59569.1 hypothetical protein Jiend_29910 [Micromonospora endophytica]